MLYYSVGWFVLTTYFEHFFGIEDKYYNPSSIIFFLEKVLGKSFDEIKESVDSFKIVVSSEEIECFLKQKLVEDDPLLKKRIDSYSKFDNRALDDILGASLEFNDRISYSKYCFEPFSLEYFETYTTILRKKLFVLLNIIEGIANKSFPDELSDLDIVLDEDGRILNSDMVRLVTPTVYNYNDLCNKVLMANTLSTYLTLKMKKNSFESMGISLEDLYPTESLQIQNFDNDNLNGNVKLSKNQRDLLSKKNNCSLKKNLMNRFD